jgi:hypothetical protein
MVVPHTCAATRPPPVPAVGSVLLFLAEFLEARIEEQADSQNNSKKLKDFRPLSKSETICSTQGYGIDRAKSSTLPSKSTEAESSADKSPNKKLTSVHSQNSATTEQL